MKPEPRTDRSSGFTFIEALVSLAVLVTVMAIAFTFFAQFGGVLNSENNTLASQQAARVALDEMSRRVRALGYGTSRVNEFNAASWQRGLIYGGSHYLAFNADLDAAVGALPPSQTVTLPGGGTYTGEGIAATLYGAETYVYTLDADGDGSITSADRSAAISGGFNPAVDTRNPMDFAIFSRTLGFNGTDYGGVLEPVAGNLFTNATTDSVYPNGTTPAPLFAYWLSEDLNGDDALQDGECINDVIDTCPPSAERAPVLYLWGDTNFDGTLSETEKTALLTMEVGSAAWTKNRLASSGAYKSSTLSAAVNPSSSGANELRVADGTKFGPGYYVQIGTGSGAEIATVDQVSTTSTPHRLMLTDFPTKVHASGDPITVLPSSLRAAVRSVAITFSAITGEKDANAGSKVAGRAGRAGTLGLDYRVVPYSRQIEVINTSTAALINDSSGSVDTVCPLDVINQCNGAASATGARYLGFAGGSGLSFLVNDAMGNPIAGKTVTFTNSSTSIGTLGATSAVTDSSGIATVPFALNGPLGTATVTASVSCLNSAGSTFTDSATRAVTVYQVATTVTPDCLSTVSTRTPAPSGSFTVQVNGGGGPVSGHQLALGLSFDSGYLPPSPDFANLRGQLTITGGSSGDTGSTGALAPMNATTNGSGQILGTLGLTADAAVTGARLNLITQAPSGSCSDGGSLNKKLDFFKLALASTVPMSGCTESSACSIAANATPPQVQASLTIGGDPVSPADFQFTRSDTSPPVGAVSRIAPTTGLVPADASGLGTLRVMNNGAPSITTFTPLRTKIDVTATSPSICTAGTIVSATDKAGFDFTGPVGVCTASLTQAWVTKISTKKICVHVKNANPTGGCPIRMTGLRLSLYNAANTALDGTILYQQVQGGAVTAGTTCTTSSTQLFKDDCQSPKAKLSNGQQWNYTGTVGSCDLPPTIVNPNQYFTIHNIEFPSNYPTGRRLNVAVSFECEGICDCDTTDTQSFDIVTPP